MESPISSTVRFGLRLIYYALAVFLVSAGLQFLAGVFRQPERVVWIIGAVGTAAAGLNAVGKVYSLASPLLGARKLIAAAIVLDLIGLLLPVTDRILTPPANLVHSSFLFTVSGALLFSIFLKSLARGLDRPEIVHQISRLQVLAVACVLILLFAMFQPGSSYMLSSLLVMIGLGCALSGAVIYTAVLGTILRAPKSTEMPVTAPEPSAINETASAGGRARLPIGLALLSVLICGAAAANIILVPSRIPAKLSGPTRAPNGLEAWAGKRCPPVTIETLDGKRVDLAKKLGQPVVLNFWATWCPPCRKELPNFETFAKETPANEVFLIGLSDEEPTKVREFIARERITYPMGRILRPPAPFDNIAAIPTTFVIDRAGIIRKVHVGYCTYEELKSYVEIAERSPS